MIANFPQYKPTDLLQRALDKMTPLINQNLESSVPAFRLLSFSKQKGDDSRFSFFVEGAGNRYVIDCMRELTDDNKSKITVLHIYETTD